MLASDHLARATEGHGHFVGDQQGVVLLRQSPHATQVTRWMGEHACFALHDGFEDHRSNRLLVPFQRLTQALQVELAG